MNHELLTVKICQADVPNKNGRIYPLDVLEGVAKTTKPILGGIGYQDGLGVSLSEVSHQVFDLRIEDGYLVGSIKILETPKGLAAKQLLEAGTISDNNFRTRGTAVISPEGVVSNYNLISVDIIQNPA